MSEINDITGKRFGRLTAIKYIGSNKNGRAIWECLCDCGKYKNILGNSLTQGFTLSCGCLHSENGTKVGKSKKRYNEYDLSGEYGIGYSSNSNDIFYFDLEDYDKIKEYCWNKDTDGYMKTSITTSKHKTKKIRLHRIIVDYNIVDHINRNRLDCRKNNLRSSTKQQNCINASIRRNNKSGYVGVIYDKYRYRSYISYNEQRINLGSYKNLEDAIIARLKAEKLYFGEFAPQRHLFKQYNI